MWPGPCTRQPTSSHTPGGMPLQSAPGPHRPSLGPAQVLTHAGHASRGKKFNKDIYGT